MKSESISDAQFEHTRQLVLKDLLEGDTAEQYRATLAELSQDEVLILRQTLAHMIAMLHNGEQDMSSGLAVMRAYIDHHFPDGTIPSKEALVDVMRANAKKIQAIAEAEFECGCRLGLIKGPVLVRRSGCGAVMIVIGGALLVGASALFYTSI